MRWRSARSMSPAWLGTFDRIGKCGSPWTAETDVRTAPRAPRARSGPTTRASGSGSGICGSNKRMERGREGNPTAPMRNRGRVQARWQQDTPGPEGCGYGVFSVCRFFLIVCKEVSIQAGHRDRLYFTNQNIRYLHGRACEISVRRDKLDRRRRIKGAAKYASGTRPRDAGQKGTPREQPRQSIDRPSINLVRVEQLIFLKKGGRGRRAETLAAQPLRRNETKDVRK